jgi:hypothetical protein
MYTSTSDGDDDGSVWFGRSRKTEIGDLKIPMRSQKHAWHFVACYPTEAVQLVGSLLNLLQGIFESVGLLAVRAQQRVDYSLEERSSCAVGVEDADRGYRHGQIGVVANLSHTSMQALPHAQLMAYQLAQPLLLLVLAGVGLSQQIILLFLQLGLAGLVLQPLEDLVVN